MPETPLQSLRRLSDSAARYLAGDRNAAMLASRRSAVAVASTQSWSSAAQAFQEHLARYPRDFRAWVQFGHILKDAGQFDEGRAAYAEAARIRPMDADLLLNRGHLEKLAGEFEAAKAFYLRSFSADGNRFAGAELRTLSGSEMGATPIVGRHQIVGNVDGMVGSTVLGWAVDPTAPHEPARIDITQRGRKVGSVTASVRRADVAAAGFGADLAGFRAELGRAFDREAGPLTITLANGGAELSGSPFTPPADTHVDAWLTRHEGISDVELTGARLRLDEETTGQLLSIVMPVYNTPRVWLIEALESVRVQLCSRWELICVDDASTEPHVAEILSDYAARDARIKVCRASANGGIARATNIGVDAAAGDYIALMDHDDLLEPEAVYRLLDAARTGAELIYTDEVIVGEQADSVLQFACRPAFSHDYYVSHPYFVHIVCVRRDVALAVGGFDARMKISADVDFVLRVLEMATQVVHIPVVLYRWRTHEGSAGHAHESEVIAASSGALANHLSRLGRDVTVSPGATFNTYRVDSNEKPQGKTLIIVPTKNRLDLLGECVRTVLATTDRSEVDILVLDHESSDPDILAWFEDMKGEILIEPYKGPFNFSRMNNFAARKYGGTYRHLLFLNNDVAAIESGWLEHMRSLCERPDVGAVGALLLYGDETVQHAGVVMGVGGPAEHAHKFEPYKTGEIRNPGYGSSLVSVRDYSAVTGACLMVRSDVFFGVGGFDEDLAIGFNDIDLCLRIGLTGRKILYDGHAVLHHYESATRARSKQIAHPEDTALMRRRWSALLSRPDPFYSPAFSLDGAADFTPKHLDLGYEPARAYSSGSVGPLELGRARRVAPVFQIPTH